MVPDLKRPARTVASSARVAPVQMGVGKDGIKRASILLRLLDASCDASLTSVRGATHIRYLERSNPLQAPAHFRPLRFRHPFQVAAVPRTSWMN